MGPYAYLEHAEDDARADAAARARDERNDTELANEVESRLADKADDELRAGERWLIECFAELKLANEQAVKIAALAVRCSELPEDHDAHDALAQLVEEAKRDALSIRRASFTREERDEVEREIVEEWADA
jgi:hypothetical protein